MYIKATIKMYIKAREELWKFSNISPCKKYHLQNNVLELKETPKSFKIYIITL
jgi:hypothetical protein